MTSRALNIRFLLILNLFLQLVDGSLSYGLLSHAVAATTQPIDAATTLGGATGGLLYHKTLASLLLLLTYVLRTRREALVANALTITACVYVCHTAVSVLKLWL
jgi:hypothetical protein